MVNNEIQKNEESRCYRSKYEPFFFQFSVSITQKNIIQLLLATGPTRVTVWALSDLVSIQKFNLKQFL